MRNSLYVVVVAFQLFGCGHISALSQSGSFVSHPSRVRHQIVQKGDGSLWVTLTPPGGSIVGVSPGPDGKMWFTIDGGKRFPSFVGNVDMNGIITEFTLPPAHYLRQITAGPDGAMWFVDKSFIGRVTTSGLITEYSIDNHIGTTALGITSGSDENVWFTFLNQRGTYFIGKITPQGVITDFRPLNGHHAFGAIAEGPDGNAWFTDYLANSIGSISPGGQFRFFKIPTISAPSDIALNPNGRLYFTEYGAAKLGEITQAGKITEYALPSGDHPGFIAQGYSGSSMWLTEIDRGNNTYLLQFIIKTKTFTSPITYPGAPSTVEYLHYGPDGNMWVPVWGGSIDVYLTHILTTIPSLVQIPGVGQTQTVQIHETQNKGGSYTAVSSDQSIATVGPVSQSNSFVVTAQGVGSCTIRVSDSIGNYIDVPVTVQ